MFVEIGLLLRFDRGSRSLTLIVVKKTEQEFAEALREEWGFLTAIAKVDGEPLRAGGVSAGVPPQPVEVPLGHQEPPGGLLVLVRPGGAGPQPLARQLHGRVFVSYNLDDAKVKIATARQLYEELPLAFQKKLVSDSKTELAFGSNSGQQRISRIISNPSKAPRGRTGDTYLDELAHYVMDREVYKGSTAVILRSHGQLTGASTPLGRRGIFWEIARQEVRPYPHHSRQNVPWWLCRFFCTDVPTAAKQAPLMVTEERVAKFGTPGIVEQFDSLPHEDFAQEFECEFVDEAYSYYPYDLILPCTSDDVRVAEDVSDLARMTGRLVAGFDVGRTRDRSELAVFEQRGDRFVCVLLRSYDQATFSAQESELRRLLNALPVARLSIDNTGIGMNLAENLAREFPQVVAETFTNARKEQWAVDFKILLQRREVALPKDRQLVAQIHSIKRQVLPSGKVSFESERSTRHGHADKFWAVALACQQERAAEPARPVGIGARVLG